MANDMTITKQDGAQEASKTFIGKIQQTEVNYVPLSPKITKEACANCRWFMNNGCWIVSNFDPEEIIATGYCDRHETSIPPAPIEPTPIPVMIVDAPLMEDDSAEMALPTSRRGLKELIVDTVKGILAPPQEKTVERAFTVFKGKDGEYYWLARHTGKFVDREDEIIANHAHDEFVTRVQKGLVPMPELWTWHKKGTSHGVADFVWKAGGFVLALGHFTGTKEQKARAVKYYQEHPDISLSHMFKYPKNGKRNKVYHAYNTVEITTLPIGAEAFPYTTFEVNEMPLTKEQKEMIRGIGGDEMVTRAEAADAKALDHTAKLDDAGVASKNVDNFEGSVIPGDDEEKALQLATKDLDARLKLVEGVPAQISLLDATLKTLVQQIGTLQTQLGESVTKSNALEQKLLEYQAVEPPASKSNDTLLNARELSLIQQVAKSAEPSNAQGKSLIDQLFSPAAPTVSGV